MTEHLNRMQLPIDKFTNIVRQELISVLEKMSKKGAPFKPFESVVTYEMVKNPQIISAARAYIVQLLKDKKNLGYLYHLHDQKMFMPLNIQVNFDLVTECRRAQDIKTEISKIASEIACPDSQTYEITRLELLYFFIKLVNPSMNWILIDYILLGNRNHAHLMSIKAKSTNVDTEKFEF